MQQLLLDLITAPPPTLAGFVVGKNHELLTLLGNIGTGEAKEKALYLWGEHGAGKSHLLRALAAGNGMFLDAAPELRLDASLASAPLLAIDNVDRLGEAGALDLFNIYNAVREANGTLLVSGPCPPAGLKLRADLTTRLGWGLVFQVHSLTDEEKIAALAAHADARGFHLGKDIGCYLLTHWRRDMGSLFTALEMLDRYSLETKRPVSVPLLRDALANNLKR
ncbi:MAG: DnaA regulatory inactivator Hda [Burkholderiales bacterium]|nr:DnaA regulatory inactivator Hda [Burkholderiales bacterium]